MDSSDPETVPTTSEDEEEEAEGIPELGQKVANYLFDSHSLGIVVKKAELIKHCLERNERKYYKPVVDRARSLIRSTFGYEVKEGQHNQDHLLFLVDTQGLDGDSLENTQLKRKQTLLFLVLGYIAMKAPPVPEASIINFLEKLDISMIDDPQFGNVKDLLTKEFPHQYYLKATKQADQATGEQNFLYDWGVRSHLEVSREELLNVYSEVLGKPVQSFVQLTAGRQSSTQRAAEGRRH